MQVKGGAYTSDSNFMMYLMIFQALKYLWFTPLRKIVKYAKKNWQKNEESFVQPISSKP